MVFLQITKHIHYTVLPRIETVVLKYFRLTYMCVIPIYGYYYVSA